jgi:hypothetical protein
VSAQLQIFPENEAKLFPQNISPHFQVDDRNWLRFGPDVAIRPGTTFESFGPTAPDEEATVARGLALDAFPLLATVPLGAPVRVMLKLTNTSGQPQRVPGSLSLTRGVIDGRVINPDGAVRTFWPLKRREDSDPAILLQPGDTLTSTITLLRGAQKALFGIPGDHRIKVKAQWEQGQNTVFLESETTVHVSDALDSKHHTAALTIFSTPDTLLSLAIVGDQFDEGNNAVQLALDNPVLKPHYSVIEAKRWLIGKPRATAAEMPKRALRGCALIDDTTVMSFDEMERLCELLAGAYKKTGENQQLMVELGRVKEVLQRRIDQYLALGAIAPACGDDLKHEVAWLSLKRPAGPDQAPAAQILDKHRLAGEVLPRGKRRGPRSTRRGR